jgi:hypothetical protein
MQIGKYIAGALKSKREDSYEPIKIADPIKQ